MIPARGHLVAMFDAPTGDGHVTFRVEAWGGIDSGWTALVRHPQHPRLTPPKDLENTDHAGRFHGLAEINP